MEPTTNSLLKRQKAHQEKNKRAQKRYRERKKASLRFFLLLFVDGTGDYHPVIGVLLEVTDSRPVSVRPPCDEM